MSETPEWQHLKAYGYAPGNYMNKCRTCGKVVEFVDKRAIACRPCAEARHAEVHPLAAAVPQQEAGEPVALRDPRMEKWDRSDPLAGMISAFEIQYGQSWTDKDWRNETAVWAAAWKAALASSPQVSPPQERVPLTEERLKKLDFYAHRDTGCKTGSWAHLMAFSRLIERAHLIGLETKGDGNG